jgi:hypothetical protein
MPKRQLLADQADGATQQTMPAIFQVPSLRQSLQLVDVSRSGAKPLSGFFYNCVLNCHL